MAKKANTLRDFSVPIPLYCHHCEKRLPKSTPMEISGEYVVACCPDCGLLTPFKVEKAKARKAVA